MSSLSQDHAAHGTAEVVSWLYVSGEHERRGYHVYRHGALLVLPQNPFEFVLELCACSLSGPGTWLYNHDSFSCDCVGRDGVPADLQLVARDRVRHVRKFLSGDVETGNKCYRFVLHLAQPAIDRAVLSVPYLDQRIVKRLQNAMDYHDGHTPLTSAQSPLSVP